MILIEEISRNWEREDEWRIAPAGLTWIAEGHRIIVGNDASIGSYAHIGNDASIGNGASEAIDLGFADGYRKCVANVRGVAYIGAGCRWFTLDDAIKHWESHDKNRDLTLRLMQSAIHIAGLKGWAFSEADQ